MGPELLEVHSEQRSGVDAETAERSAPFVVDVHAQGHAQPQAGPARPQTQVVIVEEPGPVPLIQPAEARERVPADQQAEPGEPLERQSPAREIDRPLKCECVHPGQVRVAGRHVLRGGGGVADRADQSRALGQCDADQAIEPAGCDRRVIVQQHQELTSGSDQPLVDPGRVAAVLGVADHLDAGRLGPTLNLAEQFRRLVRRAVVDQDQFIRWQSVLADAVQAHPRRVHFVAT